MMTQLKKIMLTKCPHCLGKVLLKADSSCPACHTFVDENAQESLKELVSIRGGMKLPAICVGCGTPATTFTMIKLEQENESKALLMIGLAKLLPALFRGSNGRSVLRVDLPMCATCEKHPAESLLRGSDVGSSSLRIVAHQDFARALAGQN
jgi:hypothetical protein